MIISRINGFTYVQTKYDYLSADVKEDHALSIVSETAYSNGERAKVRCYGADDVREGVAIMWHENADVSITGNSTNPTRFQHPVAGTYKKERIEAGKKVFLRRFRRRHGPYPASGQHGCGSCFLRHDRYHGPYALRRAVRGQLFCSGARRNDGLPRRGQQPDGRHDRCGRRRCRRGYEEVIFNAWLDFPNRDLENVGRCEGESLGALLFVYAANCPKSPVEGSVGILQTLTEAASKKRKNLG